METLDPEESSIDVVELNKVGTRPIYQCRRRETMKEMVELAESNRGPDDAKRVPPLDIILYDDLMPIAWSWDRLLPWKSGYVLFEEYLGYLEEYLRRNPDNASACAAAKRYLEEEKRLKNIIAKHECLNNKLNSIHITDAYDRLSFEINEKASSIISSQCDSPLVAACFMCIAEEAKLMSEWLTSCTVNDDESMAELWRLKSDFGYKVRKLALDILTSYKGNNTDQVTASMLGMKREAIIARELLKGDCMDHDVKVDISEDLREDLLDLLARFQASRPHETAIYDN